GGPVGTSEDGEQRPARAANGAELGPLSAENHGQDALGSPNSTTSRVSCMNACSSVALCGESSCSDKPRSAVSSATRAASSPVTVSTFGPSVVTVPPAAASSRITSG